MRFSPRILTGCGLLLLVACALWAGSCAVAGLLLPVALLGLWEFFDLFKNSIPTGKCERILALVLACALVLHVWLKPNTALPALGGLFLIAAVFFLVRWSLDSEYNFQPAALTAAGLLYIPVLLLPALSCTWQEQLFMLAIPIVNDTLAWAVGSRFGVHKIWIKVSPQKSIEGSLAGLAAAIGTALLLGLLFGRAGSVAFAVLGLGLGIMAQLGDFVESALKRANNVKDSGKILPGHGGILDRIDSLLFVVPVYCLCKTFWTFF